MEAYDWWNSIIDAAFLSGIKARSAGKRWSENPYAYPPCTEMAEEWESGWTYGEWMESGRAVGEKQKPTTYDGE